MNILDNLNSEQKQAVLSNSPRILVLAGAGTGKTNTLTKRIARLVVDGVNPSTIIAVTFTNKAAQEIQERLHNSIGSIANVNDLFIGTFHGLCNRFIRAHAATLNLSSAYTIADTEDQKEILKYVVSEFKDDLDIDPGMDIKNSDIVKDAINRISNLKEHRIHPADAKNPPDIHWNFIKVYEHYEEIKEKSNALDFTDLLIKGVELFENDKISKKYSDYFKHMLVDEFQDTNSLQMRWIELFNTNNLFVVGDDDQSIYKFRGADVGYILDFNKSKTPTKVFKLEQNYRSTKNILEVSNHIIRDNINRHDKQLFTNSDAGDPVSINIYDAASDEGSKVVKSIDKLICSGVEPSDIAIIYRANYISRLFEKYLVNKAIKYKITGGIGFWQRKEIKDIISYMVMLVNPNFMPSFRRSIRTPSRGIGPKSIDKIELYAANNHLDLISAASAMIDEGIIKGALKKNLAAYLSVVRACSGKGIADVVRSIVSTLDLHKIYKSNEDDDRIENINGLVSAAIEFEQDSPEKTIEEFLSNATLLGSADESAPEDCINLSTIHSAKGLEFKYVYLVSMEEGIFPSSRSCENEEDIEEERRLCYVATTRAMESLCISYAKSRMVNGNFNQAQRPSRFIKYLDQIDEVDFVTHKSLNKKSWPNKRRSYNNW